LAIRSIRSAPRELLAEAGYRDANGNFDPEKFPISEVELTYNTAERNRHIAEYVQSQWKQNLGLTVPLKNMEWKTFLDYRAKLQYKGVARTGWVGDYMDPYTFPRSVQHQDRRQRHGMVAT
jgi:oligopeptide transport system substrate-binding protein